jgi:hypothetical protein
MSSVYQRPTLTLGDEAGGTVRLQLHRRRVAREY